LRYLSDRDADVKNHYSTDSWDDVDNNVYGCVKQLYILKKRNRMIKVLLSIGGWGHSDNFISAASTQAGRERFASTAVALLMDLGFDGIDIDWEYPASEVDASNFVLLLAALRSALDAYSAQHALGHHFLISVASPAGPPQYNILHLGEMDNYLDIWHLMAYDYAGSWASFTGHTANLYKSTANPNATPFSTHEAVTDYTAAGVTASKIVIGIPLYGRSFEDTVGLGHSFAGVGPGNREAGVWEYKVLPKQGATQQFDEIAHFSYDDSTRELISYSTVGDVASAGFYITTNGLGGVFFWESSGDKAGQESLILAAAHYFQNVNSYLDKSLNQLSYPASQYANMVAGMPGE
jgi:chitinase